MKRDKDAESLLKETLGKNINVRVFRSYPNEIPFTINFKPYIVLPKTNLPDSVLRAILLHEWRSIKDRDDLTATLSNLICYLFWWHPFVYLLKSNAYFARELKCDYYAASSPKNFIIYMDALSWVNRLGLNTQEPATQPMMLFAASYMFLIQPVFLESPDVDVVAAGTFAWEHGELEGYAYFRADDWFTFRYIT